MYFFSSINSNHFLCDCLPERVHNWKNKIFYSILVSVKTANFSHYSQLHKLIKFLTNFPNDVKVILSSVKPFRP